MTPPKCLDKLIKEQKDVMLCIYQENRANARHHESQISTVSNIIILSTVGLVGFIANDYHLNWKDLPLLFGLITIGIYGPFFIAYHFKRIRRSKKRAEKYFEALDELLFKGADFSQTLKGIHRADSEPAKLRWVTLAAAAFRILWPLTISIIGIIIAAYVSFK
jgi:hypothetical protein